MGPRIAPLLVPPLLAWTLDQAAPRTERLEAAKTAIRLGATAIEVEAAPHDGEWIVTGVRKRLGRRDSSPIPIPELRAATPVAQIVARVDASDLDGAAHQFDLVCVNGIRDHAGRWSPETADVLVDHTPVSKMKGSTELHIAALAELGVAGLRLSHREWRPGLVTMCHRFGRLAIADGLTHTREVAAALAIGIDVVVGGNPERLSDGSAEVYGRP